MNDYIRILKENLVGYNTSIRSAKTYITNDRMNYAGDMLKEKERSYRATRSANFEKFKNQCINDFSEVKKMVSRASFINPETTQSPVFKMFMDGNIELSDEEVNTFLAEANASHDFTMLRAIKHYADKHDLYLDIHSAEEVINAYKQFYEGALGIASKINADEDSDFTAHVGSFADESFCQHLYDTIGNCLYSVPKGAITSENAFDNVNLSINGRAI